MIRVGLPRATWLLASLLALGCQTPQPAPETPAAEPPAAEVAPPEPDPEPEPEPEPLDLTQWPLLALSDAGDRIDLLEQPAFDGNRETKLVLPAPALDALVEMLLAYPELRVEIQAHDQPVDEHYGMKPTDRRAREVRDYLIAHGVANERLRAVGYGEDRPIADNRTEEGRAKNRRIEVWLVED